MHQEDEASSIGNSSESPLMNIHEAAAYLRISAWTLRHWVCQHKIIFVKFNGNGSVRFRKRDLDRFILQNLDRGVESGNR